MSAPAGTIYESCGLRLRSELELHLPTAAGADWDVDVRWGDDIVDSHAVPSGVVVVEHHRFGARWYTAAETGTGYVFRVHGYGDFVVSADLDDVCVRRDAADQSGLLPILMAGTVVAFLLGLRGSTVVHASAVAIDGTALAFVGQSGRGKSTLAALLCVDGAALVTDDLLVVNPGTPATCIGGSREIRLRPAAAAIAASQPDRTTRGTADGRHAFSPLDSVGGRMPIGGIVIPSPSRSSVDVVARRMPLADAVIVLLSFPRVSGWRRPDVLARDFAVLSELVRSVPVYEVSVPWGPPFGPGVVPALAGLIAEGADC